MTRSALVSVIVPCFNQARFLSDCLASLQAQTYPHWEAIIVNDGSTDDSAIVARHYVEHDARFKYIEQKNHGQAAARNRGLAAASGTYIQFLDSDDVVAPAKFELQIKALSAIDGVTLAYCDYAYGAEDDVNREIAFKGFGKPRFRMKRPIEDIAARWETELSIPIHCFLFDARVFRDHGIYFDERLANHEDWDCWMRVFALELQVVHVPAALAVYRFHPSSVSRNVKRMRRAFRTAVDTQLMRWRKDPVLRQILERKRAEMDAHYLKQLRAERLTRWKVRLTRRIRRLLRRLLDRNP